MALVFPCCRLDSLGVALAVGHRHDPLGRKSTIPAATPIPCRQLCEGRKPVLGAICLFSGHPQIADPQSLIFSPPFLLLAAINPAPSA